MPIFTGGKAVNLTPEIKDPIFAAIDRHRAALLAWLDAAKAADNRGAISGFAEAMANIENHAFAKLLSTTPTTLAGILALLRYIELNDREGDALLEINTVPGYRISALALVARLREAIEQIQRH